jgi:hypothetical protein
MMMVEPSMELVVVRVVVGPVVAVVPVVLVVPVLAVVLETK